MSWKSKLYVVCLGISAVQAFCVYFLGRDASRVFLVLRSVAGATALVGVGMWLEAGRAVRSLREHGGWSRCSASGRECEEHRVQGCRREGCDGRL